MKSDSQIREEVIQELRWEPQVTDPDVMGVAVKDGALTLQAEIEEAFKREAEIDARHISVAISDHTARLYGHVHSLSEGNATRAAAASAPGIASVESHLVVTP